MTASTGDSDRSQKTLQRLCRFEEILRFAAIDADLRHLSAVFNSSVHGQLAALLQDGRTVDGSEGERMTGDLAVVLHVVRAAHVWDELRRSNVISAFNDLQRALGAGGKRPRPVRSGRAHAVRPSACQAVREKRELREILHGFRLRGA